MPVWDTERIVENRWEHLNWMHFHFADEVVVAEEPAALGAGPGNRRSRSPAAARAGVHPFTE